MLPVLGSSPFVAVPMLPRKLATFCFQHSRCSNQLPLYHNVFVQKALVFSRKPLFNIIMTPKHDSSDAGSASKPKRSHDILYISQKVKILVMVEIEKKSYAQVTRLYGKNKSSIREVMKTKERISLRYRLLSIRLKGQNPVLSYVREREREYTANVQCSVQQTLLLPFLMLVMSSCA